MLPRQAELPDLRQDESFDRLRTSNQGWVRGDIYCNTQYAIRYAKYNGQFRVVFEAIRQLMAPPEPKRRKIGFHVKDCKDSYKATGKKLEVEDPVEDQVVDPVVDPAELTGSIDGQY